MLAARSLFVSSEPFDCHQLLNEFYVEDVRLGRDRRNNLARCRDANLERVSTGLQKLGPLPGAASADFDRSLSQGSYAMHTLNQHPDNDYDIDTGLVFAFDNISSDAKAARHRVARAVREAGGNFSKQPEARTNAVTVWYAEGYHVDLAIYRQNGDQLEHAGGDTWNACDPEEVPVWFNERNTSLSPETSSDQFRRVVRWLKAFAKSRKSWNMPGGMIMSALAAECFSGDGTRDDVALLDTLRAISDRLNLSVQVANPVGGTLTGKQKYVDSVIFLRDKLKWLLPKLEGLRSAECTLDDAKRAWRWVFNHAFWETPSSRAVVLAEAAQGPSPISLHAEVTKWENGPAKYEYRDGASLSKHEWLRFTAHGPQLAGQDKVYWIAENTGEEAAAEDDLGHVTTDQASVHSERTAYTGTHRLIVEVRRGKFVIARGVRTVKVGQRW